VLFRPGLLPPDEYDVAGATTGVVEADKLLGPGRVRPGDAVIAMAASGLHSTGYSLVRHVLLEKAGWALDRDVPELGRTLGEELLEPTRIYAKACLALAEATEVHAMSHVTGGGLAANLARVMPAELRAPLERGPWNPAPRFSLVRQVGGVDHPDLEAPLNCGVGTGAVSAPAATAASRDLPVVSLLTARGLARGAAPPAPPARVLRRPAALLGDQPRWVVE